MTLIHMPEWEKDYHTAMFGDRLWKQDYICYVYYEGVKITNKRGWISEEGSSSETESDVIPPRTNELPDNIHTTHCFSSSTELLQHQL